MLAEITSTVRPSICAYERCTNKLIEPETAIIRAKFHVGGAEFSRYRTRVFHIECFTNSQSDWLNDDPQVDVQRRSYNG